MYTTNTVTGTLYGFSEDVVGTGTACSVPADLTTGESWITLQRTDGVLQGDALVQTNSLTNGCYAGVNATTPGAVSSPPELSETLLPGAATSTWMMQADVPTASGTSIVPMPPVNITWHW